MNYWRGANPEVWLREHPYLAPFATREKAQAWADEISKVHLDVFRVIEIPDGFAVEQDVAES